KRGRVQPSFLLMRFGKGLDHLERIREIGCEADAVWCSDNRIFPEARRTLDVAGFEKVIAHQILCGFAAFRVAIAQLAGNLLLKLEGEDIGVSAGVEMEKTSQAMKEVQRILWNRVPVAGFQSLTHPAGPVHISQAARGFLDIGFELIDGVAKLPVPGRF